MPNPTGQDIERYLGFHAKPPWRVTNPDMVIAADQALPGFGWDGMRGTPFYLPTIDPEPARVNVSKEAVGFYHMGERFHWSGQPDIPGGIAVRNGLNQSVCWDGRVERRGTMELYNDWLEPMYAGANTKDGERW